MMDTSAGGSSTGINSEEGTPLYSLRQLREAVKNKDAATALKYFDIDSIVSGLVDKTLSDNVPAGENKLGETGRKLGKGLVSLMLPVLKKQVKSAFEARLSDPNAADPKGMFAFSSVSDLSDFSIEETGGTAIVTIKNANAPSFKMGKTGEGYWRIVEIFKS